jgi:MYXO-CTERM domain-containing protein
LPFDVAPGASAGVTVTYRPADLGTDSGCLNFSSNDPASQEVSLGLSGTGVAQLVPAIAVSPLSLDFGTVTIGSSTSLTTAVQNTGTGPLRVTGISLGAGTSAEFASATATPFSVAAGQSVSVTVNYRPNDSGIDTGTVLVASDDPANPSVSVSVSGAGTPPTVGVDIDIVELEVPERLEPRGNTITPTAELKNASTFDGAGSATLVGSVGSEEVYRQGINVSLLAGKSRTFAFPSYTVAPKLKGIINWTLTVQDEDPDIDQATANTSLKKGGENPSGNPNTGVISADLTAEAPSSGGCSSSGGSVGWLGLVGLGLLGARRRRTVKAPRT